MSLLGRCLLFGSWTRFDPSVAAVITHAIYRRVVHHGRVVNIVNVRHIHIRHRLVVEEVTIVPTSAGEAHAEITESIINPAIETDLRAPEPLVENERLTAPAPPSRGPEEADFRRHHPRARHPEVIGCIIVPIPVTGSPDITVTRANGLLIHGQRWRPDRD